MVKNNKEEISLSEQLLMIHSTAGISDILKKTREKKGLTIKDVANDIKIRTTFLEYIESDQFEKLPGYVYALGFVRTYSGYLGLNQDLVVSTLKTLPNFIEIQSGEVNQQEYQKPLHVHSKKSLITFIISLVFVLMFFVYFMFFNYQTEQQEPQALMLKDKNESKEQNFVSQNQEDVDDGKVSDNVSLQ